MVAQVDGVDGAAQVARKLPNRLSAHIPPEQGAQKRPYLLMLLLFLLEPNKPCRIMIGAFSDGDVAEPLGGS